MTHITLIQQRQQLEASLNQPTVQLSSTQSLLLHIRQKITHRWHQFRQVMIMGREPRVWTEMTPEGETLYQAFDPVSRESFSAQTETALRAWLEARYYR